MNPFIYLDRIYINIPKSYEFASLTSRETKFKFSHLISAVAKNNPIVGDYSLYDPSTDFVYEGRTKSYIVSCTKSFIYDIEQKYSPSENMGTFASIRQLKKLISAFDNTKNKRISAYALIYIYVIFTLLPPGSPEAVSCNLFITELHELITQYYLHNNNDELARFSCECYHCIIEAIINNDYHLNKDNLPPIPRTSPKNDDDAILD